VASGAVVAAAWQWEVGRAGHRQAWDYPMGQGPDARCPFLFNLNFQIHSNLQWFKIHFPMVKKFQIKYVFVRN
jgi:hypothetical protein